MDFLKNLLRMIVLYIVIRVTVRVVKAIRSQHWYKNIQRRNPIKKSHVLIGVLIFVLGGLIFFLVMGSDQDREVIAGLVILSALFGLIILLRRSKEKKYYDYLKDNFNAPISDYRSYEVGIKLMYLHAFSHAEDFFQDLYSKNPTKVALYHIYVIDIFLRQKYARHAAKKLEKMLDEGDVSSSFGDIYCALAMAYGKLGYERITKRYSKLAEKHAGGHFHKIFNWDHIENYLPEIEKTYQSNDHKVG